MTKKLSDQLADLSVRAKGAEQALDAAEREAHDKIVARKEQAHAAATKAVEKVNQEVKSANDTANRNWSAVKAKIADDMNHLKVNVALAKHEHDVKRAENRADGLEWEAEFAIDYAIAAVEQARCRRRPPGRRRNQTSLGVYVMKTAHLILLAGLAVAAPATSQAQVAGSTFLGSTYAELRDVAVGWSAKKQIIGSPVFNDLNERIGSIDDVIVTPDKSVSYAIINAGRFLAVTKHDVAVPVSQLKLIDHKLVLAGATKDALKASPPFEYAN